MKLENTKTPGFFWTLVYYVPFLFCCGVIFYLSSLSEPPIPKPLQFENSDKLLHFTAYAITGVAAAFGSFMRRWFLNFSAYLEALCLTSFYGVLDEFHQVFTPMRTPDVWDWVADTLGAACAILLFFWLLKHMTKPYDQRPGPCCHRD